MTHKLVALIVFIGIWFAAYTYLDSKGFPNVDILFTPWQLTYQTGMAFVLVIGFLAFAWSSKN